VGPQFGVDNAVVRIGDGMVMVSTTDPLSFIPSIQPRESALLSVHLLASDLTTSSFPPQYGIFDFNLPPKMKDSEFASYWKAFHEECRRLGIAIVGGHTGKFEGCDYTIIGGGVIWSIGPEKDYLVSSMAENGDDLILTKSVAFGATAVLTRAFPRTVKKALGERLFEKTWRYLSNMSTVKEALAAASVGIHRKGVTAMHDATEGGVVAAILELANASRLGADVSLENLPIRDETEIICKLFHLDPLTSLSEGSLVIASRPDKTRRILNALCGEGIEAEVVGSLSAKFQGCYGSTRRGRSIIRYPTRDPYWQAFSRGVHKGWS
jgi:hydrogenase expression/formation protein HypE